MRGTGKHRIRLCNVYTVAYNSNQRSNDCRECRTAINVPCSCSSCEPMHNRRESRGLMHCSAGSGLCAWHAESTLLLHGRHFVSFSRQHTRLALINHRRGCAAKASPLRNSRRAWRWPDTAVRASALPLVRLTNCPYLLARVCCIERCRRASLRFQP